MYIFIVKTTTTPQFPLQLYNNLINWLKPPSTSCQRNIVEPKDGSLVFALPSGWGHFGEKVAKNGGGRRETPEVKAANFDDVFSGEI